jgi:redox-sensitive bicupin YhaK (pirin superfamily)
MMSIRPSEERGHTRLDWLDSRHTFSFGDYVDPAHTGFRALVVINEDVVAPGRGFGTHPHRDMEILTWVLGGAVEHRDSMGNQGLVRPGEIQRMTAGTGVLHSEMNPSPDVPLHLLQIWIHPAEHGLAPGYEQRAVPEASRRGRLCAIAAADGREGAVHVHQDCVVYAALLALGEAVEHPLARGRGAWVQVARGEVDLDGEHLRAGDGAAVSQAARLALHAVTSAEVLVFDLA